MPTEASLWKWLREFNDPVFDQERVENAAAHSTPDVEGQFGDAHFHLELKVLHKRTVRNMEEQGILKFEVGQREWGQRRWSVGGSTYLLVQGFDEDLYLIPGAYLLALPRIGTVKTSYLRELSWWFCLKKNPDHRRKLYHAIQKVQPVRQWVIQTLDSQPDLRQACTPHPIHPAFAHLPSPQP